jgi:tryptophanyl-tRNA synthetase
VEFGRELVRRFNTYYGLDWNQQQDRELFGGTLVPFALSESPSLSKRFEKEKIDKSWSREDLRSVLRATAIDRGLENFLEEIGIYRQYFNCNEILSEPQALLTHTPRLPGLDGRKMSKSYGNAITLSESDEDIRKKTKVMVTDPARKRRTDPGNPDVCPVYDWHKLFSPKETLDWAAEGCRTAGIGCIECKSKMADHLISWIAPVRERRLAYEKNPKQVLEILDAGSAKAQKSAQKTMERVRESVFHWKDKRASL